MQYKLGTEPKKERKTMKPRTITLDLSDADVERVRIKAASGGLSVKELLENFLGDLVDGDRANGSNETRLAEEWFDLNWFELFSEKTFLTYLTNTDQLNEVLELEKDIKALQVELQGTDQGASEYDRKMQDTFGVELKQKQADLEEIFADYQEWTDQAGRINLEKELETLHAWQKQSEKELKPVKDKKIDKRHDISVPKIR